MYETEVEHASRQMRHDMSVSTCQQELGNVSHTTCQVNASQVAEKKQNREKKEHTRFTRLVWTQCLVWSCKSPEMFLFLLLKDRKETESPLCSLCCVDNESGVIHLWHCWKHRALVQVVLCWNVPCPSRCDSDYSARPNLRSTYCRDVVSEASTHQTHHSDMKNKLVWICLENVLCKHDQNNFSKPTST